MSVAQKSSYASSADKRIWMYWGSWVRWMVAPVLLFIYLSFILHVEVMPHKMDTLALALDFLGSLTAYTALAFAAGFSLSCWRRNFWASEAEAWTRHTERRVAHGDGFSQRAARYRWFLWGWALAGGIAVVLWPYFQIAAVLALILLVSLAHYVQVFWVGAPRSGWFSVQVPTIFFLATAVIVASVMIHSASDGVVEHRDQIFSYDGNFVLGQSVTSNWFFVALTMFWALYLAANLASRPE